MVRVSGYIRAIECLESLSNWCLYSGYLIRRISNVKNAKNLQSTI